MNEILSFAVLVALTIGLTEVVKQASKAPKNFIPLIALVLGFVLTLVGNLTSITSFTVLTGIAIGLSSVGLFSQKKLLEGLK